MAQIDQSTTYARVFYMNDPGLTVSVAISKAGGAFAAAAGVVAEISDGYYKVSLTIVDTNTLGDLAFNCTASGADRCAFVDQVGPTPANVVNWKGAAAPAMTGDAFARLGAPAGASVAADVAAVKAQAAAIETDTQDLQTQIGTAGAGLTAVSQYIDTEVAAIKAKTDLIPAVPAAVSDIPTAAQNADKLLGRNMAGGADGGRTVTSALRSVRNKVDTASVPGVAIVYQENDTTEDHRRNLTIDASALPIVTSDPTT